MAATIDELPVEWGTVGDARRMLDPVRLMRDLGMEPDPWQGHFLRSHANRVLLLATRQAGKSTATAILALHTILYRPGALVVMVSPTQRQSGELYLKLRSFYEALDRPVSARKETETTLSLENGSRVVSLPGSANTVRSFSAVHTTIIDEAALTSDDLIAAVSPMRAVSQGRLLMISTPKGQRGHFFEMWERGGDLWERYRVTADQCPRIDPKFLAEERRNLGDLVFEQEYMARFVQSLDQIFATDLVMGAFRSTKRPLFATTGPAPMGMHIDIDSTKPPLSFQVA